MEGELRHVSLVALTSVFCSGFLLGGMALAAYQHTRRQLALRSKSLPNPLNPYALRYSAHEAVELLIRYDQDLFHPDNHLQNKPFRYAISPGSAESVDADSASASASASALVQPGTIYDQLPAKCPTHSESWTQIFADVRHLILPGMTHWRSPNFFGYFKIFAAEPSVVGELLCAQLNAIGFTWLSSPVVTELEQRMMEWCRQLFGFSSGFSFHEGGGGVIQGTASESTLCALLAARQQALDQVPQDQKSHVMSTLVAYATDQTHVVVHKGCRVLGLHHLRVLPTVRNAWDDNNFAMDPTLLAQQMARDVADGLVPFFVVPTIGTTSTTAIDPIVQVVHVARQQRQHVWVHVDAAYAGVTACCPEFRHWFVGIDACDSICVNAHKWLLVAFDCSLFWVRHRRALTDALTLTPVYLRNENNNQSDSTDRSNCHEIDYKDWQVPLGRRFRALKLWFTLRRFGVSGLQTHIRRTVQFAH